MFQIASFKNICTDSTEMLFSKLRSAGLSKHKVCLLFLTVWGVSNKHCLLTFFITSADIVYIPSLCDASALFCEQRYTTCSLLRIPTIILTNIL